ncbi:MAG: hypothetical protein FWE27_09255 [Defluviitaleaceae bacterium]|nr:hypothetical protein [Defluviitaleaceae bacterium]
MEGKIYCAFSGTGKTIADSHGLVVDIERYFYKNDISWDKVADVAVLFAMLGRNVAFGSDIFVREALKSKNIKYTVIYPHIDDKDVYRQRYLDRPYDNVIEHAEIKCGGWYEFMAQSLDSEEIVILPKGGYLADYLRDAENIIPY